MLKLRIKPGEGIVLAGCVVRVLRSERGRTELSIEAPPSVHIARTTILDDARAAAAFPWLFQLQQVTPDEWGWCNVGEPFSMSFCGRAEWPEGILDRCDGVALRLIDATTNQVVLPCPHAHEGGGDRCNRCGGRHQ